MNNSSMEAEYVDLNPTSTLFIGICFSIISIFGIPLNIFIVIATARVQEIRAVSSNLFIGSLALSDVLTMLFLSLHLPYALTSNETLCKIIGFGVTGIGVVSAYHPPFLALNRYAVVCHRQEKLAEKMFKAFSWKGIYWMIILLWVFAILYLLPFLILDSLGLHSVGFCAIVKKSTNNIFIRAYYYCGVLGVIAFSNVPLLIFYRKVSSWVKKMSARLSLSVDTKKTVRDTENVLLLTKWVTVIPIIFCSPLLLIAVLSEFDPEIVSVGVARLVLCLSPFVSLLNAIVTLKFARPYRRAFKRVCDRAPFASILFSWMIEGRWLHKVDVVRDNQTSIFVARS